VATRSHVAALGSEGDRHGVATDSRRSPWLHVAHTGSTSKTLAPGMRLGWLIPPSHLHADLVAAKPASDLGSPALPQLVLAHLLASGAYDRHLRLLRSRQRRRRDAMLAALHVHLPQAHVHGVAAGLHLLITLPDLPDDLDDTDLAVAVRHAGGPPGLVLGYAAHPPDQLHEAVQRLAATLARTSPGSPPQPIWPPGPSWPPGSRSPPGARRATVPPGTATAT